MVEFINSWSIAEELELLQSGVLCTGAGRAGLFYTEPARYSTIPRYWIGYPGSS